MKPVLFLSHSSKDNERAKTLDAALRAGDRVDTTFDARDLRHGEEWRPQLYRWMARCQGGVLLITDQVMKEPYWVLQEATFLRARSMLEGPAFRLFMVIDMSVYQHETWKKAFDPLKLDLLQRFKLLAPSDDIAPAVAAIHAGMQELTSFTHDHRGLLAQFVFDKLEPFTNEELGRHVLAENLEIDDAIWQAIAGPQNALRTLCARRLAAGELRAFGSLANLFAKLQDKAHRQARLILLGALRSYWVPLEHAEVLHAARERLRPTAAGEPLRNVVVVHTEHKKGGEIGELHLERRFLPYSGKGMWTTLPPGNESEAALRAALLQQVGEQFFGDAGIDAGEFVQTLADERTRDNHLTVFIDGLVSAGHVAAVAREFWPCLFVLTVRGAVCAAVAAELGVEPVTPPEPNEVANMRAVKMAEQVSSQNP